MYNTGNIGVEVNLGLLLTAFLLPTETNIKGCITSNQNYNIRIAFLQW